MKLTATKTPLLIAAIATAITLTSLNAASAKVYWASADADVVEVVPANFKLKVKKHHAYKDPSFKYHAPKHHGFKHHGPKKKKYISKHDLKKKLILKKLF